jgi:hypothetical protein
MYCFNAILSTPGAEVYCFGALSHGKDFHPQMMGSDPPVSLGSDRLDQARNIAGAFVLAGGARPFEV